MTVTRDQHEQNQKIRLSAPSWGRCLPSSYVPWNGRERYIPGGRGTNTAALAVLTAILPVFSISRNLPCDLPSSPLSCLVLSLVVKALQVCVTLRFDTETLLISRSLHALNRFRPRGSTLLRHVCHAVSTRTFLCLFPLYYPLLFLECVSIAHVRACT